MKLWSLSRVQPVYAPESDQGTGNDLPERAQQGYERLVQRHNGDNGAVGVLLFNENYQYRQRIRELEARLPADDAVVLNAEEAAHWQALRSFQIDDIRAALEERDQLRAQVSRIERKETVRKAAALAGFDADVLMDLPDLPDIEVTGEGDAIKAEIVKDGTRVPLTEYVASRYTKFLPALQVRQQGVVFPEQGAGAHKVRSREEIAIEEAKRLQRSGRYSGF